MSTGCVEAVVRHSLLRVLCLGFFVGLSGCAEVVTSSDGGAGGTGGTGGTAPEDCANNFDCGNDEYCVAASCGGPGNCELRPADCPLNISFVCGCDAQTYDNACQASQAGVRIASAGECACDDNDDCNGLDYCEGESCAGAGTCEARPQSCPVVFDPVCGCDGNTYDSECVAEMQGVRIESTGPCPCTDNTTCLPSDYCAGEGCETPGSCELRPTICVLILAPVCGCDSQTYSNSCVAFSSGVRVDFSGACP